MTFYVKRDEKDNIVALYNQPVPEALEMLGIDDREVLEFLTFSSEGQYHTQLLHSDLNFIRVVEDLVNVLLTKSIIKITDFPTSAVEKLVERRGIREQLEQMSGIINTTDLSEDD